MSNLTNFFGGGGGGSVPLQGVAFFAQNTPVKMRFGTELYLRSGHSEVVEFDPSLQSWVDDNIMFTTTHSLESTVTAANARSGAVDTDGQGRWMVGGWATGGGNTLPRLFYSADDGANWLSMTGIAFPTGAGAIVTSIRAGGSGVWFVTISTPGNSVHSIWRTTDNGQNWVDYTTTLWGPSGAAQISALETDRAGNWMAISEGATYGRKSSNNGATWANFNFPFGNGGRGLRAGGDGVWIAGLDTQNTPVGFNGKIAISSNFGQNWSAELTVQMSDFAWVKDRWVGMLGNNFYFKASADFTKWDKQFPLSPDFFSDYHNGTVTSLKFNMIAGLDGSLWLPYSGSTYRSSDYGVSWTKLDVDADYVMAGPNKRAVAVNLSNNINVSSLKPGIVTGRPAAGIPASNIGKRDSAGEYGGRLVAYVRLK